MIDITSSFDILSPLNKHKSVLRSDAEQWLSNQIFLLRIEMCAEQPLHSEQNLTAVVSIVYSFGAGNMYRNVSQI